ncbi:TetR family transcriptional regulator [Limnohabitans sp. JirII-31]|nr:TetR family transcriptional regulator [Limnohabitans sp. JirII-31]
MPSSAPSVTTMPETVHKRERRKEARPGELLDAALTLFVEKGFAATRVEEVASHAGVSKGTLFLYFPTKEDLFKAVIRENIAHLFPTWNEEFKTFTGTSAEMLRYAMQAWWHKIGNTPASGIAKLVMSEASNFPDIAAFYQQEVIRPGNALIRQILERGVASGEFRPIDPDQAVYTVIAPMIFLMMWKHSMGACATCVDIVDPETFIHLQVDVLLHGMTSPTHTP